jgi:hypothetical protein
MARAAFHQMDQAIRDFGARAAIDEILFDAAQFRKFRKDRPAAERRENIGRVTNRGIGGKAGKTVGASAFQSQTQARDWGAGALSLIRFHQAEKCAANCLGKHGGFGAAVLLFDDHQGLIEIWIPLAQFLAQNRDLRVLAAETEHRCSGDVGMIDVTGDVNFLIHRGTKTRARQNHISNNRP